MLVSRYDREDGSIEWAITNLPDAHADVTVLDAYTGNSVARYLHHGESFEGELELEDVHGWYDLTIAMAGDPTFKYQLAGYVETGRDSSSNPALGGLVSLKS